MVSPQKYSVFCFDKQNLHTSFILLTETFRLQQPRPAGRDGRVRRLPPGHDVHARAVPLDEGEEVVQEKPDAR